MTAHPISAASTDMAPRRKAERSVREQQVGLSSAQPASGATGAMPSVAMLVGIASGAGAIYLGLNGHLALCGLVAAVPVAGLAAHLREKIRTLY